MCLCGKLKVQYHAPGFGDFAVNKLDHFSYSFPLACKVGFTHAKISTELNGYIRLHDGSCRAVALSLLVYIQKLSYARNDHTGKGSSDQ